MADVADVPPRAGGADGAPGTGGRGRPALRLAAVLLALAVLAGLGLVLRARVTSDSGRDSGQGRPGPGPKPMLTGLVPHLNPGRPGFRPVGELRGYVFNASWADLQPTPDGPLTTDNDIDRAVATARARHLQLKVRVLAGTAAPAWAKALGGPPVEVANPTTGARSTIGRFWLPEFGRRYAALQAALAARYDSVPEISEVVVSRCTSLFSEPFLRQGRAPGATSALLAAGYTAAADERCQQEQIDAHRVWQRTRSGLAFNPYQRLGPDGSVQVDEAFTERMMSYCRARLGPRCVLENYSIRAPIESLGPAYGRMYAAMARLGPPMMFQTAAGTKVGDLPAALSWAAAQGAGAVEVFRPAWSRPDVAALDARLTAR